MTFLKIISTALLALVAGLFVETARADEAYVCDGGRIVYVKFGELERMKRQDPCIAAYYGMTVAGTQAPAGDIVRVPAPVPASRGATSTAAAGAKSTAPGTTVASGDTGEPSRLKIINGGESGRWFFSRRP
jgi:hypothetical protein